MSLYLCVSVVLFALTVFGLLVSEKVSKDYRGSDVGWIGAEFRGCSKEELLVCAFWDSILLACICMLWLPVLTFAVLVLIFWVLYKVTHKPILKLRDKVADATLKIIKKVLAKSGKDR